MPIRLNERGKARARSASKKKSSTAAAPSRRNGRPTPKPRPKQKVTRQQAESNQRRNKLPVKIVGPKTDDDRMTEHERFMIVTKLENLGSAREPAETKLLKKLRRWK